MPYYHDESLLLFNVVNNRPKDKITLNNPFSNYNGNLNYSAWGFSFSCIINSSINPFIDSYEIHTYILCIPYDDEPL